MAQILCPKCRQPVEPAGQLTVDDGEFTVYQCDRCILPWQFDDDVIDTALTFALDADGNVLDAESGAPLDLSQVRPSQN